MADRSDARFSGQVATAITGWCPFNILFLSTKFKNFDLWRNGIIIIITVRTFIDYSASKTQSKLRGAAALPMPRGRMITCILRHLCGRIICTVYKYANYNFWYISFNMSNFNTVCLK